jgi:hypothetical protein
MLIYFFNLLKFQLNKIIKHPYFLSFFVLLFISLTLDRYILSLDFNPLMQYDLIFRELTISFNYLITRLSLFMGIFYIFKIDINTNYHSYIFLNRRHSSIFITTILYLLSIMLTFGAFLLTIFFTYNILFIKHDLIQNLLIFDYKILFYLIPNAYIFALSNSKIEKFLSILFIIPMIETPGLLDGIFALLFTAFFSSKVLQRNINI